MIDRAEDQLAELLSQWEQNYKRGLLTFWVLLLLHEQPMYALELGSEVSSASHDTVTVDDNSIYRALRRFEDMGLVSSFWQDSDIGPRRRYYELTELGERLLRTFTRRNVLLFQIPDVARRIARILNHSEEEG
jgi:DNA-binding PadR family transcriptional regulator